MQSLYEGKWSSVTVSFFSYPAFCSVIRFAVVHVWFFKKSHFNFQLLITDFQRLPIPFVVVAYTIKCTKIAFHFAPMFALEIRDPEICFFFLFSKAKKKKWKTYFDLQIVTRRSSRYSFQVFFQLPKLFFQPPLSFFLEVDNMQKGPGSERRGSNDLYWPPVLHHRQNFPAHWS